MGKMKTKEQAMAEIAVELLEAGSHDINVLIKVLVAALVATEELHLYERGRGGDLNYARETLDAALGQTSRKEVQ